MKKKIISILVCMLLFGTVLSVTGATNNKLCNVHLGPKSTSTDIVWSDDFDSYALYQYLDGDPEDGGWECWAGDPTAGAYVTDNQSRSSPHSVDIAGPTDLVHKYSGASSGNWTFTAWQYVPSDMDGESAFILLNTYTEGGADTHWSTQLSISATTGRIMDYDNPDDWLPLITDDWAEIRVEIDFEADIQTVYYDDGELLSKSWTEGVQPGGAKNLAAVDLFANSATSVYYDDLSLEGEAVGPDLLCDGELVWENVTPGDTLQGSFTVENVGGSASELDWEIKKEPSWGTWTFDQESGEDLTPEDGPVTVQVTCVAPDKKNEEFYGKIKVENMENPDDVCYIDVTLTTPVNKPSLVIQFFERLIQRFPILEQILFLSPFFSRLLNLQ